MKQMMMTLPMVSWSSAYTRYRTDILVAEFINEGPEEALGRDDLEHRRLDRRRGEIEDQEDVEETVRRLRERYARQTAKYDPHSDHVPQRLLMPGVNDPSLYSVKVKVRQSWIGFFSVAANDIDWSRKGAYSQNLQQGRANAIHGQRARNLLGLFARRLARCHSHRSLHAGRRHPGPHGSRRRLHVDAAKAGAH